ncbi:3-dehydroquinate synthase [Pseudahrensia aquimaris]|uniref:3-dehydroquinate synthase n=1 Tax=Pseudahrensia aquimaris TaxID=744461 RepID=A0ABW3FCP7_9HYPH
MSATDGADDFETIRVDLDERSYDIVIGAGVLAQAGTRIAELLPSSRAIIITDETVNSHHGDALRVSLDSAGIAQSTFAVPAGEKSKSYDTLQSVCEAVLEAGMERGDVLIAFGGGVVGDLAGFAAGVVRRGMPFVQIPTSLLAQVDSSVGGKTGINSPKGKNLVGLFNQPALVLADTALLDTLSEREMRAGYAEVAKYGLIDQPEFFSWLEKNHAAVFAGGAARRYAVATSCRAKADVVKADERENGARALLNLGHTFGHALEASVGYDATRLVHGEGVAIGMVLAHEFSHRMNHCGPEAAERVVAHLKDVGLPTRMQDVAGADFDPDTLMNAIAQDKKVQRGALTFILTRGIGQSFVSKDVPRDAVAAFLRDKLAAR